MKTSPVLLALCVLIARVHGRVGLPLSSIGAQTAGVRMVNNCGVPLWFEARQGGQSAPLPGESTTMIMAAPQTAVDYNIPDTGLPSARFWAKYGCDDVGRDCTIGDQQTYWSDKTCPTGGCNPPIDSLFEATFGCAPGTGCATTSPTTWFDTSQVDGYTIPYKLDVSGPGQPGCDLPTGNFHGVDASQLDLARCPYNEDLSQAGQYPTLATNANISLSTVDLRVIDPKTNMIVGCISPCKRLNYANPYGYGQPENVNPTLLMCCPTPGGITPCTLNQGCVTSQACRTGPIVNTKWVNAIHTMAPGVYSYAYDDLKGLHACPAATAIYTMTFCPAGAKAYPTPASETIYDSNGLLVGNSATSTTFGILFLVLSVAFLL